jgi:hypothetical protein
MLIPDTEEQNMPITKKTSATTATTTAAATTVTVATAPKPEVDYTNTCSICNENYNKSNHKKIVCYCNMEICSTCIKTYILSKNELPHCFQCNIEWTREFMIKNITQVWVKNEYSEHYRNILFKMEESQFMDTIPFIEEKNRKRIEKEKCLAEISAINEKIIPLKDMITRYQHEKSRIYIKMRDIENGINMPSVERKTFIRKCPYENCIGYLSTQHKCDLCNNWFCTECNELKGLDRNIEHTCNPDTLETVKLLQRECKNCPKCTTIIYKIDGCDMMWCVSCHTAFSWRTLQIMNGENIHNPHYFEWLRTQNGTAAIQRNPNDIICGREINNQFVIQFMRQYRTKYDLKDKLIVDANKKLSERDKVTYNSYPLTIKENIKKYIMFGDILNSLIHIQYDDIERRFRNIRNPNDVNESRNLRINFMEKEISEFYFKTELEKRNKNFEKNNQINTLLRMYITCMTDIIYTIYNELNDNSIDNLNNNITQIYNLVDYVNQQFNLIGRTFNCAKYRISCSSEWKIKSN